jgi:hypothetical protein
MYVCMYACMFICMHVCIFKIIFIQSNSKSNNIITSLGGNSLRSFKVSNRMQKSNNIRILFFYVILHKIKPKIQQHVAKMMKMIKIMITMMLVQVVPFLNQEKQFVFPMISLDLLFLLRPSLQHRWFFVFPFLVHLNRKVPWRSFP